MSSHPQPWTIGIEEEFQIIDPLTRALRPDAGQLLHSSHLPTGTMISSEIQQCQIELAVPICQTLADVRRELLQARRCLLEIANAAHLQIAAAGTHPFSPCQQQWLTAVPRYQRIAQRYQQIVREQVIFGCHVHVGYRSRQEAVQVMNYARVWLAPLLALSANSPFWLGSDTSYDSYRTLLWWRWPLSGPPPYFPSANAEETLTQALVATNSIEDATHLYWDLRLSHRFPTLEFRCMDVCLTVDEAVMLAGLIRALVQTCSQQVVQGAPCPQTPTELLKMAHWQAARYGLSAELIDVLQARVVPAQELIEQLLTFLHPALAANGEWEEISFLVQAVLRQGTGAMRQRAIYEQRGNLLEVVDFIVAETATGAITTG